MGGVVSGFRFRARVVDAVDARRHPLPTEIEVQQWESVQYEHHRVELDHADGRPAHAVPRGTSRLLVIIAQSGSYEGAWLLSRAWNVREDGTTEGQALGQRADLPAAGVVSMFRGFVQELYNSAERSGAVGGRQ